MGKTKRLVSRILIKALLLLHKYIVKVFVKMMPCALGLDVTITVDVLKNVLFVTLEILNLTLRLHFTTKQLKLDISLGFKVYSCKCKMRCWLRPLKEFAFDYISYLYKFYVVLMNDFEF